MWTFKPVNVDNGSTAGVTSQITGAVHTDGFNLGTNTLNLRGAFAYELIAAAGGAINTTLASPSVYGNINAVGAFTYTGAAATVNVTVPTGTYIPVGTTFTVVNDLGAGAGSKPILVALAGGTNPLYTFSPASTLNGDLRIQLAQTPLTTASTVTTRPCGESWTASFRTTCS